MNPSQAARAGNSAANSDAAGQTGQVADASPEAAIEIKGLSKIYEGGFEALKPTELRVHRSEIFALLGPNGAGKTTLISIICGLVNATGGTAVVAGHDLHTDYRAARSRIGLVPQELSTDAFDSVWGTLRFSRGLFGKPPNDALLERVLRDLSLWEKRNSQLRTLSGGMKRRVMIAKALVHEPEVLFLDEPTAGVDVELRREMWELVRGLRASGVTIILTTHYIEEAEEMADRIGVIHRGEIILVEEKNELMRKLGSKQLTLQLQQPIDAIPEALKDWPALALMDDGHTLVYTYDARTESAGVAELLRAVHEAGIVFRDLHTRQSSLEDIFVSLVQEPRT